MLLNNITNRIAAGFRAVTGAMLVLACAAAGAAYPERGIRLVNPFPPTGPMEIAGSIATNKILRVLQVYGAPSLTDGLAWRASQVLSAGLAQPVSVDRRARGRGIIGHRHVVFSAADGYTLIVSDTASLVIYPERAGDLGFDPAKDLAPVAIVATMPMVLAVGAQSSVLSVPQLIAQARSAPGRINLGSAGDFTVAHLALESMRRSAGIEPLHVAYNGGTAAVNALIASQIVHAFVPLPSALRYAHSGALRLLALAARERFPGLPQLPTMEEAGVADVDAVTYYGFFAPAGTPARVIARLNSELVAGFNGEAGRRQLLAQGLQPAALSASEFAVALARERARWAPFISALVARDRAG